MIGTREYQKMKEDFIRKYDIEPNHKLIAPVFSEKYADEISKDDEILATFDDEDNVSQLDNTENAFYYHYLEDNFLDQHFSLCTCEMEKYMVYFCMYSVQMELNPFLKFILTTNNVSGEYAFPFMEFACSQNDDVDTYFKNECIKYVVDILNVDHLTPDQINYMYEGFISEGGTIFVVIDVGKLQFNLQSDYEYAIIDEIINYRAVKNVPIDKDVVNFFFNHNYMIHLSTIKDEPIQYPIVVYSLKHNDELTNVYYNDKHNDSVYKIAHPLIGDRYYFTSAPINNDYTNIVRYGFFSHKSEYIVPDITTLNKEDINIHDEPVYFHENGQQYWGLTDIHRIFMIR